MREKDKLRKNKFMRNKKSFIFLLILCLGVGFAFLSSQLTITGNTSVSGNRWSVYFNNVQVNEASVDASVVPTTTGTTTTSINYTVSLDKPGDFYEFTVDAVNAGTIDAMIESITMTTLDSDVAKYLNYTATYLDGTTLAQNDVLKATKTATYKVRVEYKKDIESTDLDEDGVNLNLTFGVNYVQSTIKPIKFIELAKNSALNDSSLDFTQISSDANGKGLFVRNGTQNDTNPIYYYRGNVDNNNVKFADFCWKIVRTTDTGGTKLIYNGLPSTIYSSTETIDNDSYMNVTNSTNYPYTFDNETNKWTSTIDGDGFDIEMSFSVKEEGDYFFNYNLISSQDRMRVEIYKDDVRIASVDGYQENQGTIDMYGLTSSNIIKIKYDRFSYGAVESDSFIFDMTKGLEGVTGCRNISETSQLSITSAFNTNYNSPAYNGYMYGTVYEINSQTTEGSFLYGSTFTYSNGAYTLSNTHSGVDSTHHYTCLSTSTSCESVKYVYYVEGSTAYYITLNDGKSVEDALGEMQTNTTSSTIKTAVDNWFNNTFRTYFTNNSKDYNNYLEDTVWCNDRSMNTIETDGIAISTNNGWISNGGSTSDYLWYSAYGRKVSGMPNLACSNKNDSFTVTESASGNGALTYPVGLLTTDEIVLAGGQVSGGNNKFYLFNNQVWWTMSPSMFDTYSARGDTLNLTSSLDYDRVDGTSGVRPSISIKSNIKIDSGNGTSVSPYEFVVE